MAVGEGWSWHSRQLNAIMALIIVGSRATGIVLSLPRNHPCNLLFHSSLFASVYNDRGGGKVAED